MNVEFYVYNVSWKNHEQGVRQITNILTDTFSFLFRRPSSGDPHVHIIKQVKPTDEGLYTCIAGNVLGQATASAYLEVNSGPRLYSQIQILGLSLLIGTLFRGGHAAFLEEHQHRGI
ncbi:unnamed protein product [Lepeophtheirus salmonis]|uniref:(salmon louse) hypothetical protein n=1 Tax=Lepeophtheirus salmonis TaxID=72036 RepID=A0A7R8D6N3_LEPSM|nr:unnamed protein product [Lepeophtheirus salmonis]CAF3046462.1 unnamed protein product [Lepeophtheirus salmonis]